MYIKELDVAEQTDLDIYRRKLQLWNRNLQDRIKTASFLKYYNLKNIFKK